MNSIWLESAPNAYRPIDPKPAIPTNAKGVISLVMGVLNALPLHAPSAGKECN